ncbi:peroxide stress protein YaaA [Halomonas sp. LR3S48]|uniref:peroxide stress protein YaaA n=1 Tax=Halomonas sp. LR3S48 TaxID=2982694 RepID=UPI0021E3A9C9|nr:peroxide stress protein YaaA [Halomonas sp. LR3S48]UYG04198.1 peroxide stress protein YaaA [Halomonas sp. LR3S48]
MLSVISPAKTLDFETPATTAIHTQPDFLDRSQRLITILRDYSPQQLSDLMGISDKLAGLNAARFAEWRPPFSPDNAKPAAQAFQGDVYMGLEAATFSDDDNAFAQQHLRILSGLYGLLRPLDLIQPYRLEMGTRLPNPAGQDLYAFWQASLTEALDQAITDSGSKVLVNLASNEYFKAVDAKRLDARVITPVFKDEKNGKFKIISFYAKKARGLMAAWMIQQRLDDPERLKEFDVAGYAYNPAMSEGDTLVFTRREDQH